MGASRNGNSLSTVNAYIGCKTENVLSLFIVEFQPRQYVFVALGLVEIALELRAHAAGVGVQFVVHHFFG